MTPVLCHKYPFLNRIVLFTYHSLSEYGLLSQVSNFLKDSHINVKEYGFSYFVNSPCHSNSEYLDDFETKEGRPVTPKVSWVHITSYNLL